MMQLARADRAGHEAHPDVEQREGEGFRRASEVTELTALGEKEAVEEDFEHEQAQQNADLDRQITPSRGACGAHQPVTLAEVVALPLEITQVAAQAVQFVSALRRLGAKLTHRGRRRLTNRRKPPFEIETGQPLLEELQLVEKDA